jgi:hypothetical protein
MNCTPFPCNDNGSPDFCGEDAQYPDNTRTFTCYNADGSAQSECDSNVDEGEIVADSLTGLKWQRASSKAMKTRTDAVKYCDNSNYGGYDDWRLPSIHELLTIADYGQTQKRIDNAVFPPVSPSTTFWSSTTSNPSKLFYYADGMWAIHYTENAFKTWSVRCVRGKKNNISDPQRFLVNGQSDQKIVIDQATGLEWQQTIVKDKTWKDALKYCESLNYGGHDDWRLPNINEVRWLFDFSKKAPVTAFPEPTGTTIDTIWTSTTAAESPSAAWFAIFAYGSLFYDTNNKTNSWSKSAVKCVRKGP